MGHLVRPLPHDQAPRPRQVARDLAGRIKPIKVDINNIHGAVGGFEVQAMMTLLVVWTRARRSPARPARHLRSSCVRGSGKRWRMSGLLESTVGGAASAAAWTPTRGRHRADDAFEVEIQLPGVKSKDIDVEANGQDLVVTGEIKEKERKGVPRHGTRRTGAFEYRLRLPGGRTPRTSHRICRPVCSRSPSPRRRSPSPVTFGSPRSTGAAVIEPRSPAVQDNSPEPSGASGTKGAMR